MIAISKRFFTGCDLSADVDAAVGRAVERRHYLHKNPQMAYEETVASGLVQETLRGLGLDYKVIAGTGVVVDIKGQPSPDNRIMAFRGDMDALPVTEATGLPYASENKGFMHACGHDGHTVMLLAAVEMLAAHRDKFRGTVRAVFQPAEELGAKGAKNMVDGGCFEGMGPHDPVFGYHNWPTMKLGTFGTSPGAIMAAADYFNVVVKGRDGHVGMPDSVANPIPPAAEMITEIRKLERRVNAQGRKVSLETTKISAPDGPMSAVPGEVKFGGSLRSFDPELRMALKDQIEEICAGVPLEEGVRLEFSYKVGTDPTINTPEAARFATEAAVGLFGEDQVDGGVKPAYTAEDFGRMLREQPGAYIWLGQGTGDPACSHDQTLHAATYDFNDKLIPVALALTLKLVERGLPLEGPSAYPGFEV